MGNLRGFPQQLAILDDTGEQPNDALPIHYHAMDCWLSLFII